MALDTEIKPEGADASAKIAEPELEEMLKAGLHFGYSRSRRYPKMGPYIYGIRNNVEVFDVERTRECLRAAEAFLEKLGSAKKVVMWVGTKPSVRSLVEETAKELGAPYVAERWLGGTLTNAKIIRDRLKYFVDLRAKKVSGELAAKYTKKEQSKISRELSKLERYFGGLEETKNGLEALVLVDPKEEKTALHESLKVKMPTVGIMSSDSDPRTVTYPIPANDTSPSSVGYILRRLKSAYQRGLASSGDAK
ncbi:MAG: 30S ribosomal protein S2 [Patescibacteria group bacterium]